MGKSAWQMLSTAVGYSEGVLPLSYARLIVNPAAGAGRTAKLWPQIRDWLQGCGYKFEYALTEAPGHAIELAKSAVDHSYPLVVSVGGDGTINEIVNGLYETGNMADVMLGIISTGTGADYIRTMGLPRDYQEACRRLLAPRRQLVDLGIAHYRDNGQAAQRIFVNFAGLGFDAEVVKTTTQRFKALGRTASYLMGLLSTLLFYANREVTISLDGQTETMTACTIVVGNGRYGGGRMLIAPEASLDDGLLDVIIIGNISKPDLLWSLPRIYKGTHLSHPKVTMKRVAEVKIETALPASLQADGELLGETPARFQVLPAALNLIT